MNDRDRAVIDREDTKAQLAGRFGSDGTRWGSANGSRAVITAQSQSRRRCDCGCGGRATHVGLGDGIALMGGCEMHVRRWVRDGYSTALGVAASTGWTIPAPPTIAKETTDV